MTDLNFEATLQSQGVSVRRSRLEILQINMGRLCNQACHHCHVEAGPSRTENMTKETVERILTLLESALGIHTVDLTGGAPELNPHFRDVVVESRRLGKTVIDRCNLTVLSEPGQEETAWFLREHEVQIVASLPCYARENVEKQRGRGVFDKSIEALKLLNRLGYGEEGGKLKLDLVYNPAGPFLPPDEKKLELSYRQELKSLFGIEFNRLYTITNMPIKRFLADLRRTGKLQDYMDLLVSGFNPRAAESVMCRNLLSVGWDGELFDCDFNQMLEIPLGWKKKTIWTVRTLSEVEQEPIAFGSHCFGCTAGSGSSCSGALI